MSRSVLVVDDDAGFRELVGRLLDGSEYAVVAEAGCVRDAIARAVESQPDAALVDIGLPDGDGLSLAEALCALPRAPRIVLISTDADAASGPAVRRAGACGFLCKDQLSAHAFRQLLEEA